MSSEHLTCSACKYAGIVAGRDGILVAVCRRHPPPTHLMLVPGPKGAPTVQEFTWWPSVNLKTDWCGELEVKLDS